MSGEMELVAEKEEEEGEEAEYHSKDFEWEELRTEVENSRSYSYHLLPFQPTPSDSSTPPQTDSDAWKRFHNRHSSAKFFKERRYLLKEFPELATCQKNSKVLEVGCGNGSTVLPLLRGNENIMVYACDCSSETVERVKEMVVASNIASNRQRFYPFHCDLSVSSFPKWLSGNQCRYINLEMQQESPLDVGMNDRTEEGCFIGGMDFITLIFTLSAFPLENMPVAVKECFSVLKPGGLLLFRDYGLYDMTMLRFEPGKRVGLREYMRSDGTRSYFFCLDKVRDLFVCAGFTELELEYCCIKSTNRRKGKSMRRVWVHGKFQKPF